MQSVDRYAGLVSNMLVMEDLCGPDLSWRAKPGASRQYNRWRMRVSEQRLLDHDALVSRRRRERLRRLGLMHRLQKSLGIA